MNHHHHINELVKFINRELIVVSMVLFQTELNVPVRLDCHHMGLIILISVLLAHSL